MDVVCLCLCLMLPDTYMPATGPPALLAPPPLSASYFVWYHIFSNSIWHHVCHIMKTQIIRDMDVADRPAMFSLPACLAPAFCFLFRMVFSIVKHHSLISRRVLWMSFVSAHVLLNFVPCAAFCFLFRMVLSIVKRPSLISRRVLWMSFVSAYV